VRQQQDQKREEEREEASRGEQPASGALRRQIDGSQDFEDASRDTQPTRICTNRRGTNGHSRPRALGRRPPWSREDHSRAPTGVDAHGFGVEAKGIVTKSIERLSLHLNAGYEFLTASRDDERDGRYTLVVGASYPVGAPRFTRATLIGDVFAEQSARRGEPTTVGTEVGFRYQLTPRIVWDAGVGTECAGPTKRSTFSFTTGLSFGF
jgi:Putative MetA-pathway of phenol degradation